MAGLTVAAFSLAVSTANAVALTIGSNLLSTPSGSICEFEAHNTTGEHVCTVGLDQLDAGHASPGGLKAPFDGVIVKWSVASGPQTPSTASVRLALRAVEGPGYLSSGSPVELPASPPGSTAVHSFPERMPISAGQPIGLTTFVTTSGTGLAGVPIAYRAPGIGSLSTWSGARQLGQSEIWDTESDVELLLQAEIEPDSDRDGFGDLTQDICLNRSGSSPVCAPRDLLPPSISANFARRQPFLRRRAIVVRVRSTEAGEVSAEGRLEISGKPGWTYWLRSRSHTASSDKAVELRMTLRKGQQAAARRARREGHRVTVKLTVFATDLAGNQRNSRLAIKPG